MCDPFVTGEKIGKMLALKEANIFKEDVTSYAYEAFLLTFVPFLATSGKTLVGDNIDPSVIKLDPVLLRVAIESAFVDLYRASKIHNFTDAPSLPRKGAAVASWLNRIKPIRICGRPNQSQFVWLDPFFSLLVGYSISWSGLYYEDYIKGKIKDVNIHNLTLDAILEDCDHQKLIMYHLLWHSPDYRALSLILKSR